MTANLPPAPPAPSPSSRPGMGTMLYPGGAAFRVWAPFAPAIFVAGAFNQWSATANPFASEGKGYWSVEVPGAKIGDEYQFVIPDGENGIWHNNPYASEVVTSSGNAIIHDPDFDWTGNNFVMPPWNELVIYEMHVGTFNDAPGTGPGTFEEIIPKLAYLNDLGINAIEIMPVAEFPMDYSWGYNPAQPFSVETALGGPQGLYEFVKAAHAQGIAVLLDVVYNHFGPGDLDLWRFDGWSSSDHNGGIYFYDNSRAHTPWGDTRPDYGRPEVRQYIRDNALFWLDKYRLDGLRFDSVVNIRNRNGSNHDSANDLPDGWSLLQWINNEIRARQPWKITVAEDLQDNDWITRDTGAGGVGFGSQWDAAFVHPIRNAIITANDADRDLRAVSAALLHGYNADAARRVIYTESHDEVANGHARVPEEIWPGNAGGWFSRKRSTLGAAMVFTAPGIPMIFQGQEFLEDKYFQDSVPLDWTKLTTYARIHSLYRDLIRLRRNWFNQTRGLSGQQIHVHHVNHADKVLGLHRWANGGPGDDVVVVANFANRSYTSYTLGFPRAGRWRVRFNSDWQGYIQTSAISQATTRSRAAVRWTTCRSRPTSAWAHTRCSSCRRITAECAILERERGAQGRTGARHAHPALRPCANDIHLHCLVPGGVYRNCEGTAVFYEVAAPTIEELQALLAKIISRIMRLLTRQGFLIEEQDRWNGCEKVGQKTFRFCARTS